MAADRPLFGHYADGGLALLIGFLVAAISARYPCARFNRY